VGVLRLGLAEKISEWMEIADFLPAPGQGAIAVQCRAADEGTRSLLAAVDEPVLRAETEAERGFLRALGGGCSAPVGAFAQTREGRLRLRARVSALDGSRFVEVEDEGDDPAALVAALAGKALSEGAAELIAAAGRHVPPAAALGGLRVVVTRAREQADDICRRLAAAGAVPLVIPMIRFSPLADASELDAAIARLETYRWLVFASANGVEFFMKRVAAIRPSRPSPGAPRVAAVGPGTAAAAERHGISVDFVPRVHTAAALAEGLIGREKAGLAGAAVLMPRALEGREDAAALLRQSGARVDDVPAYRTEPFAASAADLDPLDAGVDAILFSSSSAVSAWCDQAAGEQRMREAARRALIACIGPTTAATARDRGLRVAVEASAHTAEGLVEALGRHYTLARGRTT
jgi:uroporphyrinogen-III synthase